MITDSPTLRRERRLILFALISAFVLLITLALFALRAVGNQALQGHLFVQSLEFTNAFELLFSTLKDAETGQRGFLITQEAEYLQTYVDAVQILPEQIQKVDALVAQRPEYQSQWDEAKALIRKKLETLEANAARRKEPAGTVNVDQLREGKAVMDEIRRTLGAMIDREETIQSSQRELREAGVTSSFKWMGFLASAAVLLTGMAGFFVYRDRRMVAQAQALAESEDRLRMAMTAGRLGSWDWNIKTGEVVWDETRKAMFGIPDNLTITYGLFLQHVHAEDRDRVNKTLMQAIEERRNYELEMRAVLSDGTMRWLQSRGAVKCDANGKALRLSGIAQDITERKTMETRLREWNQELEQRVMERTKSLRDLATELNLAEQRERKRLATDMHDHLQQLLVTCKLKLKLAQGKRLGEEDQERARLIDETDELLAGALNYTRTLVAELSPPVLSEHGLGAALKWLADYMKRYGLVVSVSVPERRVRGLPEDQAVLLFQSVRELLFNASKHAGTHEAWVTLEQKEAGLRIEVRDNGVGFAASSPVHAPTEGSSKFGLFSIRERMSALGGSLHITSSPEVGTRAVLLLPLIKTTDSPLPLTPATEVQVGKDYCRKQLDGVVEVLLVDDHAMVRQGLRAILESYPDLHVIGEAVDGREALEAVRVLRPHVVIMDVNMPVMDGVQATRSITQEYPDTIVVGLSVNGSQDNRELMIKAGAVDLLTKEAAVEQLHESIVKALKASFPA